MQFAACFDLCFVAVGCATSYHICCLNGVNVLLDKVFSHNAAVAVKENQHITACCVGKEVADF